MLKRIAPFCAKVVGLCKSFPTGIIREVDVSIFVILSTDGVIKTSLPTVEEILLPVISN